MERSQEGDPLVLITTELLASGDQGHLLAASTMSCQPGEKHKSMLPLVDLW